MTKLLVGLAGKARVGKDTAGKYLQEAFHFEPYALADPIKNALHGMGFNRKLYDTPETKEVVITQFGVSYRKLAQSLGTEWGRAIHPEFWLILARMKYATLVPDSPGMVVTDVRFENEAQWVRDEGGVLIHIAGPQRTELAADGQGHSSEAGVACAFGDVTVTNTGSLTFLFGQLFNCVRSALDKR